MSSPIEAAPAIVIPPAKRRNWRPWGVCALVAVILVVISTRGSGVRASRLWTERRPDLVTLTVDKGSLDWLITESGTLESADNATVRCQVEAMIGQTGGAFGSRQAGQAGNQTGQPGQGNQAGGAQAGGAQNAQAATDPAATPTAAAKKKAATTKKGGAGGAKAKATGAGVSSPSASAGAASGAGGAAGGASGSADPAAQGAGVKRPDIRSFAFIVEPYVPLRPKAKTAVQTMKPQPPPDPNAQRRSRGGGPAPVTEQSGSTRIISIIPEGSRVSAGDVVCELDSSAFRDERQSQQIRFLQAKSWVEQAQSILEVNEISLREYRDGVYPQDVQLIRQYINTCKTETQRTRAAVVWSREAARKGYRASAQVNADALAAFQAEIALHEAEGMSGRLELFTSKRIVKAYEAKIAAIRADLLAQEQSFQLESERLRKLETMISNCTMKAPRDGIIVYANQSNSRGQLEVQIQEGATVRQTQPIFYVPNPKNMQVKAKINESKVGVIRTGQSARLRIDAFPDQVLHGTVAEITPIPAPANRSSPDVQIYYATIRIDTGGFDALRPGLSAEVVIHVESRGDVTRVPLQAIRWLDSEPYAALVRDTPDGPSWEWKPVKLGLTDTSQAEVLAGLSEGDRVAAEPDTLASPRVGPIQSGISRVPQAKPSDVH